MGEYGYTYPNSSTYGSRTDEPYLGPAIRKPFVSYVPNSSRSVATATSPYGDEYSRSHGSPTWANNRTRDDYEYGRRQTNPVHSGPHGFTPAATTEWRASPQSSPYEYNGAAGYGENGYGNREGQYRAVGSPVRNDNYCGNGYKGREWEKPSSGYSRNDNYDYEAPISYNSSSRPKNNSSGWTPPPRNGTQLSEPTNNIGKAMGLLKEAARLKEEGYNYNFTKRHF